MNLNFNDSTSLNFAEENSGTLYNFFGEGENTESPTNDQKSNSNTNSNTTTPVPTTTPKEKPQYYFPQNSQVILNDCKEQLVGRYLLLSRNKNEIHLFKITTNRQHLKLSIKKTLQHNMPRIQKIMMINPMNTVVNWHLC